MPAFKPTPVSGLKDLQSREEFVEAFGEPLFQQIERLFVDTLAQVHMRSAYFRERELVENAVRNAQREFHDKLEVIRSPHFEPLLRFLFRTQDWVELDTRGTVTTHEMWDKEQRMLLMAGEEDNRHQVPYSRVDNILANRTLVDPKTLPASFLAQVQERFPRAKEQDLESRLVVSAATQLGYECYGVNLTWNRPGATGLEMDKVGSAREFLQAIREEHQEGGNWFVKPVVFVCDDWSTDDAKALKEEAKSAGVPVICATRTGISDEQVHAVIVATTDKRRVAVIEGTAGAGKSFTMKSVYEAYTSMGYEVIGTALGWSAAKVLRGSTGLPERNCRSMRSLLDSMKKSQKSSAPFFTGPTLIIVDEAGMVGTRYMHDLMYLSRNSGYPVKIVLTGDSRQLPPVDAGSALEAIIKKHGTTRIDTIRRQKQESHRMAIKRFSNGESGLAMYPFLHQECLRWAEDKETMFNQLVRDYVSYRHANPDKAGLILAYTNEDIIELNSRIREVYKKIGQIDAREVVLDVTDSRKTWRAALAIGDEVVFRANDQDVMTYYIPDASLDNPLDESKWDFKTTGVFNRNSGKIVGIRHSVNPVGSYDFIIDLDGEDPARVVVNSKRFVGTKPGFPVVHNYATTIYASQGMTVNQVFMVDHPRLNNRLAYVGMSRHTDGVSVYFNETELHQRLDRMLGKSPSRHVANHHPDSVGVRTQRYSRTEMLQAVAMAWGTESNNYTATVYRDIQRYEKKEDERENLELAAKVRPASISEPVTDFIPELNQPYPLVDIEKILGLPDPISEAEFVRPSDAEENRAKVPIYESPVVLQGEDDPRPAPVGSPAKPTEEGLLSKALGWVRTLAAQPAPVVEEAPRKRAKDATGSRKPAAPFQSRDVKAAQSETGGGGYGEGWFRRRRADSGSSMPMVQSDGPLGLVDEKGVLRFENVPQTLPPPDGSPIPGPTDAFLTSPVAKQWWTLGRFQEPRVVARNPRGEIVARYALDGRCMVGDGFPPIAFAPKPSEKTPIHIVPGVREWFLLQELYDKKFAQEPEKRPHVIWGAPDVDWKHVAKSLQKHQVVIIRSKHDQGQLPWALAVEEELRQRWDIQSTIAPRPPAPEPANPSVRSTGP